MTSYKHTNRKVHALTDKQKNIIAQHLTSIDMTMVWSKLILTTGRHVDLTNIATNIKVHPIFVI